MSFYIPSHFRVEDHERLLGFIDDYGFGSLVSTGPEGFDVSHIPFLAERLPGGKARLLGHVARANPHARHLAAAGEVMVMFRGPHAYVSPTWYENHPAVPTWNYAAVHVHGRVTPLDEAGLRTVIERLSAKYEAGRPRAWRLQDQPPDFIDKLVGVITGFAVEVERIEGKFKLSQNRPGRDAERVIEALSAEGESALAELMREFIPVKA